jgi:cobalt-zinc-cadmium efflux system protein
MGTPGEEEIRAVDEQAAEPHDGPASGTDRVNRRPLAIALAITVAFLVAEVIGGLMTGSLALLADAGHMATDAAALALSLFAVWLARRPATPTRSFGFLRAEVLAALVNAATLVAISIFIFWEAFRRIGHPPAVDSGPMLAVAVAGLAANAVSAWVLTRGGGHEHNLNTRGAFLHVVGDLLGSAGAIAAALVMLATGWYLADPLLSAGIGLLILWGSWRLLRESLEVLLEATPPGIDPVEVRRAMAAVDGVADVHDLHVWTVTSGLVALSSHVEVSGGRDWHPVLIDLSTRLRERFGIAHVTLQPEEVGTHGGGFRGCSLDSPAGRCACLVPAAPAANGAHAHHGHRH